MCHASIFRVMATEKSIIFPSQGVLCSGTADTREHKTGSVRLRTQSLLSVSHSLSPAFAHMYGERNVLLRIANWMPTCQTQQQYNGIESIFFGNTVIRFVAKPVVLEPHKIGCVSECHEHREEEEKTEEKRKSTLNKQCRTSGVPCHRR